MKRILFICSQNRLRSPTAEQVFSAWPTLDVSSAGLNHDAENPLTPDLLDWADVVFVMENIHRKKLQSRFRASLNGKKVICLGIKDEYEFMEPALVSLLQKKVTPHLGVEQPGGASSSAG